MLHLVWRGELPCKTSWIPSTTFLQFLPPKKVMIPLLPWAEHRGFSTTHTRYGWAWATPSSATFLQAALELAAKLEKNAWLVSPSNHSSDSVLKCICLYILWHKFQVISMNQWQRNHLPIEASISAKKFISTDLSSSFSEALTHNISSSDSNEMMPWCLSAGCRKKLLCCIFGIKDSILPKITTKTKQNKKTSSWQNFEWKTLPSAIFARIFPVETVLHRRNTEIIPKWKENLSSPTYFCFLLAQLHLAGSYHFPSLLCKAKEEKLQDYNTRGINNNLHLHQPSPQKKPSSLSWSTSIRTSPEKKNLSLPIKKTPEFPDCPVPQMICTDVKADTDVPS